MNQKEHNEYQVKRMHSVGEKTRIKKYQTYPKGK